MRHYDAIVTIYNGLNHNYQSDITAICENNTASNVVKLDDVKEIKLKAQEHMVHCLEILSEFAFELDEPVLAENIYISSINLQMHDIPPIPM
ncbi:hypothetical protein [Vibrio coralliilyticus]|uniref:hypothetical protein n=1 Tax=Vibrio coralliilyticus TaxID=190893 RepID=UPI0017C53508|nr:hypothetical protein [Vibrio coralliilyticus]NUW69567.1 hypothetical protein [Vibrio coralliilyticus]